MAAANKEQPAGIRRNRMNFCGDGPTVRRTSGPIHIDTEAFHTLFFFHLQGVWIPTFGSFDIISREITTANVTLQWPVFQLATNLVAMHGLQSHGESLPAYRKLEPLKRSQVAADASLSWHIVQASIQNTVFLISSCLKIGEKVAIVLKDIGVIFIDGMTFQMKFYYDFLQKLSGKENLRKAVLKAPWLMKMVMSRVAPVASLSPSGCLVVFPEFQMELVPKPPSLPRRKSSGSFPAERKLKEGDTLPPLAQGQER
ncbi:LOW QUALITY PROTEIN: uncharacterized protein LOC107307919 [Coturnix japonica]|uniref:LOW QUALITY PROTEIN: uncharacterized protein LOC107307919 n=1 Tax=Coturnix japonica TaxID=93934 RepID=UPI0007781045|nr:LOW QUALITY PROTEIN: uncharacterized protein LOC107307919 [Coturnix japonica]